jgi:Flp pilus assembly protein TadG
MTTLPSHVTRVRSVLNDTRGTALLEFAITLPVLLSLYLGCVQMCDAVSVYRKTTTTTRTIADLTSQYTQVSDSELQSVLNASSQIMVPHSATGLKMVVTQLSVNSSGAVSVDWSKASGPGAVALTAGTAYTLPTGVAVNGTSIIVSKVEYTYISDLGGIVRIEIPFRETIYMYPRSTKNISKV